MTLIVPVLIGAWRLDLIRLCYAFLPYLAFCFWSHRLLLQYLDIAPGLGREFAFTKLKRFDAQAWAKLRQDAEARRKPVQFCHIYGSDLYGDVLKVARENLDTAGLLDAVELKQCNVLEMPAPAPQGVLVTNPPYGVRIGEQEEQAAMYPELGHALKQKFTGWRAYFFTADFRLAKLIRLSASRRIPLFNGPLECRLFEYRMVAGGMRREKPPREG